MNISTCFPNSGCRGASDISGAGTETMATLPAADTRAVGRGVDVTGPGEDKSLSDAFRPSSILGPPKGTAMGISCPGIGATNNSQ